MSLFGGDLVVRDMFSTALTRFSSEVSRAGSSFNSFNTKIGESERANRLATEKMKRNIADLANEYVKQGYTMSQAIRKATSEIARDTPSTGSKWVDTFGRIKQVGVDTFGKIGSSISSFSDSTLGMISKLTLGFVSLKGVMTGIKEGFSTGMEYQNLRLILNNLYGKSSTGGEKFKMATDFASNSIWQEKDVVRSLAMLKGSGLKDDESSLTEMSDLGSFEKSMGVGDINTATRAYMEMMQGRWNMMTMELGIKREDVETFAKSKNMKSFDNKRGEIKDKSALETAFKGYIGERGISGISDKVKDTLTGKLSTLKDNVNKSLAGLIGVTDEGTVRSGSAFEKFCNGVSNFTKKIQEFTKTDKFEKLSNKITAFGDKLFNAFSFIMDNPEIITNFLKLGVALWAIGKIGGVISAISTIASLFGTGGIFAGVATALAPIAPIALAVVSSLWALGSVFSEDGSLHQGISWLLGNIPFVGGFLQQAFEEGTTTFRDWFSGIWDWIKSQFGLETDSKNNSDSNIDTSNIKNEDLKWYGKDGKEVPYKTASQMVKDGTITKSSSSKSVTNKTDIHLNVDTIKETADVDEVMNKVADRMTKYSNTRNNVE